MAFGFKSQLTTILNRKHVALARVRKLELMISVQQAKLSKLEKVVDVKRQAR